MIRRQESYRTTIKDQFYLRVLVPRKVKKKKKKERNKKRKRKKNVDAL